MADPKQTPKSATGKPAIPPRPRLVLPVGQDAIYSNVVRISHSPSELVFDFGRMLPGEVDVFVKARVMMSPLSAKLLQRALADNIAKYETTFGEIKVPQGKTLADDLFHSLQPPEPPPAPPKPEGLA
ncbi:MAG: DUF3467 domain-containing protein [Anaerolineales bacterium]